MKCKTFTIETNGTTSGTIVKVDGKPLGFIKRLNFSAETNNTFITLLIENARIKNGVAQTKKVQIRDPKTQKFVEKEEFVVEPLRIEFERQDEKI